MAATRRALPRPAKESIYLMNDRMELYDLTSQDTARKTSAQLPEATRKVTVGGDSEGGSDWVMAPDGVWYRVNASELPALKGTKRRRILPPNANSGSFTTRLEYDQWRRQQHAEQLRRDRDDAVTQVLATKPSPSKGTQAILEKTDRSPVLERMDKWEAQRSAKLESRRKEVSALERRDATFKPRISSGTKRLAATRQMRAPKQDVFTRLDSEAEVRQERIEKLRRKTQKARDRTEFLQCTFQPNVAATPVPDELLSSDSDAAANDGVARIPDSASASNSEEYGTGYLEDDGQEQSWKEDFGLML